MQSLVAWGLAIELWAAGAFSTRYARLVIDCSENEAAVVSSLIAVQLERCLNAVLTNIGARPLSLSVIIVFLCLRFW